jgi:hypothetical protein
MKRPAKPTKLTLQRETIRALQRVELERVMGGDVLQGGGTGAEVCTSHVLTPLVPQRS